MDKILNPKHPVRCILTGPSKVGKIVFRTNLILITINEYNKIYIFHQVFLKIYTTKFIKCFSNYILIHIIPNCLNEVDIDIVIEEIVNTKDFEKSDTEIETYEIIKELRYPPEYENNSIMVLDDLNEKK